MTLTVTTKEQEKRIHEEYWLTKLSGDLPKISLPFALYSDTKIKENIKAHRPHLLVEIPASTTLELKRISKNSPIALFILFLSGLGIVLHHYTGNEDLIVGTVPPQNPLPGTPGSNIPDHNHQLLLCRYSAAGHLTFKEFITASRQTVLEIFKYSKYPFDELYEKLQVKNGRESLDILNIAFIYDQFQEKTKSLDRFHLVLVLEENKNKNKMILKAQYDASIYRPGVVQRFCENVLYLFDNVSGNLNREISKIEILSREEKQRLLVDFNHTAADYPALKTIHGLFAEQVRKTPDHVALLHIDEGRKDRRVEGKKEEAPFGQGHLSYNELNEQSHRLAYLLKEKGVKPDSIVSIMVERSLEMIISIIAILKANGAYLPIDPGYPEERIQYMLKDAMVKFLVNKSNIFSDCLARKSMDTIFIDDTAVCSYFPPYPLPAFHPSHSSNLAYIIYTSGTTGKPKGVMIQHRNVVRLLFNSRNPFDFTNRDVWTMFHSYCFDFSVWEMYGALLYGGKLLVIPKMLALDTPGFQKMLQKESVTVLNQTPTAFYQLLNEQYHHKQNYPALRYIIFGGEALAPAKLKEWAADCPGTALINMFGITETTVHVTYKLIGPAEINTNISNIGRPLPTLTTYIMDHNLNLLPLGTGGELCVGGEGVGRGYLNQPELTAEKFVPNPYKPTERLYRSGDLAVMQQDGEIAYLGRKDHQVKIRGFRVELGEIENHLLKYPGIKDAVVIAREPANAETSKEKYLCANIIPHSHLKPGSPGTSSPTFPDINSIREYLSRELPDYMLPSYFVILEKFPLTPNGKINRKALPDPAGTAIAHASTYIAPRNEIEKKLTEIWKNVLGRDHIGIRDDFFQIGGHSLKAAQVLSRIYEKLEVKIQLKSIFQYTTIEELAQIIARSNPLDYEEITAAEKKEHNELSHAQKRLWILDKFEEEQHPYIIPGAHMFKGALNREAFKKAISTLFLRHSSLRTTFITVKGQPRQKVLEINHINNDSGSTPFKIESIDLRNIPGKESLAQELANKEAASAFDLARGPLAHVKLLQMGDEAYIFLFTMHHIISDGWSLKVIANEVFTLYNAYDSGRENPLPPLRIQYKDYAAWQNKKLTGSTMNAHENYWKSQFEKKGEIPVLQLHTDFPRPPVKTFNGDNFGFILDKKLTKGMKQLGLENGVSLFMVILASLNTLLFRYTGQHDIVIGTVNAGRNHKDLENQVGFYLDTLPLRTRFQGTESFNQLSSLVKEITLGAFEHQGYPFDRLVDELDLKRDLSRSPLFDVLLILQNTEPPAEAVTDRGMNAIAIRDYPYEYKLSKFDLTFSFDDWGNCLFLSITYNSDLFSKNRIQQIARHYKGIVAALIKNPGTALDRLDYIPAQEKKRFIFTLNKTHFDYPGEKTIQDFFEDRVEKAPRSTAVVFNHSTLTYACLNGAANRLAHYLRENTSIQPEQRIGIILDKSEKILISMLGILKAGAAFVAMDPEDTGPRLGYVIYDSQCSVILTHRENREKLNIKIRDTNRYEAITFIDLDDQEEALTQYKIENLTPLARSGNIAYVVFTSGSTGKSKGVVVEHKHFCNNIEGLKYLYPLKKEWKFILSGALTFDASYRQIFLPLFIGAELHVVPDSRDIKNIVRVLQKACINVVFATPILWRKILEEISTSGNPGSLILLFSSGDALTPAMACRLKELFKNQVFITMYGPTETTLVASHYEIKLTPAENISFPLGKPYPNYKIYVLDPRLCPVPQGVPGEICIAGNSVTRGYQNNPELTKEKFVDNPFSPVHEKLYKTGDIGIYLNNGNIYFLGRKDHQVKIRGIRVELGEIESVFAKLDYIKEAVVCAPSDKDGSRFLTAYFIPARPGQEITISKLREDLARFLPPQLIPSSFVELDVMPLTTSGKIDRQALANTRGKGLNTGAVYAPPRDDLEKKLVEIWKNALGIQKIGIFDNFFDLGGNSITAVQVIHEIDKQLNINIALIDLFRYPSIDEYSNYISDENPEINRSKKASFYVINSKYRQTCTIICFPPMMGLPFAFHKMKSFLKYPLYLFNMLTESLDGDPIDSNQGLIREFVKQVDLVEKKGPLILIGWSAGGKLAFEICQALEASGTRVNKLILIDTSKIIWKVSQEFVQERLEFHRERLKREKNTEAEIRNSLKRIKRFFDFYLSVEHTGTINADIVMIASKLTIQSPENIPGLPNLLTEDTKEMIGTKYWKDLTTGKFTLHIGHGWHGDMFDEQYVEKNTLIIKRVLEEMEEKEK
jgi:amino acid adenylation domain-containing protein